MVAGLELQTLRKIMTSGSSRRFFIRKATSEDLDVVKQLADQHRAELGFVLRPALEKSITEQELLVAQVERHVVGFVHYHHRRDHQTTLYHIAVNANFRGQGIGKALIDALALESKQHGKQQILLRCPIDLTANSFYKRIGFSLLRDEDGNQRKLKVWRTLVTDSN